MKYIFLFLTVIPVKSRKTPNDQDLCLTEKRNQKKKPSKLSLKKHNEFNVFKIFDKKPSHCVLLLCTQINKANCQGVGTNQNNFRPGVLSYEQNQTTNIFLIVTFCVHIILLSISFYLVLHKLHTYIKNTNKKKQEEIAENQSGEEEEKITTQDSPKEDQEFESVQKSVDQMVFREDKNLLIQLICCLTVPLILNLFNILLLLKII